MAIAAATAWACTDEVPPTPAEELYMREFVKRFGLIDKEHTWNGAERAGITVTTGAAATVTVRATDGKTRYLLARYEGVDGTRTLSFDIPPGCTELIVSAGRTHLRTQPGGHADFVSAQSRAIWDDKTDPNDVVRIARDPYRTLSDEAVRSFAQFLPEGENNVGKMVQNFSYVAEGPFTIYPVFWNTRMYNTLGIYYINHEGTDREEMVYVPFYTNKIPPVDNTPGNILYLPADALHEGVAARWTQARGAYTIYGQDAGQWVAGRKDFSEFTADDWRAFETAFVERHADRDGLDWAFDFSFIPAALPPEVREQIRIDDFRYTTDASEGWRTNVVVEAVHTTASSPYADESRWTYPGQAFCSYPDFDRYIEMLRAGLTEEQMREQGFSFPAAWQSRGIHIDIKPGTRFGMYIRTEAEAPTKADVGVVASPVDPATGLPESDGYTRHYSEARYNAGHVHAATYSYRAPSGIMYTVLGFEDWSSTRSADLDLNDMVFFIDGQVHVVEDGADVVPEWIVACEDLGEKDDFDFNDVVFSVRHVAGSGVATVTPLAAGGTLETYLCRALPDGSESVVGDVEWHLLFDEYDHTTMINSTSVTHSARPIEIAVPEDFTLSALPSQRANMGGFYLKVHRPGGSTDIVLPPVTPGIAPQMLLIPQPRDAEGNATLWEWPRERRSIELAYPLFREWIKDAELYHDWHSRNKNASHTVRR